MAALGSLVVQLAMDYAQYTAGLDKSEQETLARTKRMQEALDGVKSTASTFAVGIGAAIAGAFSVAAFKDMLVGVTATQTELKKLSDVSGVSVEKLSGMAAIAKLSSTQTDQLADSMNQLTQKMVETKKESDPAAEALKKIGINFKEFRDLTPDAQFLQVAKSLDQFEDGAGKSAAIMAIMGEEGAKLLPFMKDLADAGEIQAKVTKEQIEQSEIFQRTLKASQASTDALKTEFVNGMVPALNIASKAYNEVMNGTSGVREEARNLAADGSIKNWTIMAVKALSYVVDAGQYVWRTFQSIGSGLAGLAASATSVLSGDFTAAFEILKMSGQDMIDAFKGETWGEKYRAQIDALASSAADAAPAIAKPTLAVKDFVQAGDEGAKAADKMAQAYASLMSSIEGKIAALKKEQEAGRQLTDSEKELVKLETDLRTGKLKLNDTMVASAKARIAEWGSIERTNAALKLEREGLEDARQSRMKYIQEMESGANSLFEGNKALEEEIRLIGKTAAERTEILKLRNEEIIAIKEAHAAELMRSADATGTMPRELAILQSEIEMLRDRNGLLDTRQIVEDSAKAAEESRNAWKPLYDSVSQSLTDALMTGGKNAKQYLMGMLRSLFIQPFVMNIVGNVMGIFGMGTGSNGGKGGNAMGIVSNANSMYSAYGAGMQFIYGGTAGSSAAGMAYANGVQYFGGDGIGALYSANGGWAGVNAGGGASTAGASAAGMINMAAGVIGGVVAGKLISGGYGFIDKGGYTSVAGGTAIGAILGGPIGAIIGGAIGGVINRAFGRKLKESGIEGTFGGDTGFEGRRYEFYKGGWFRSNKTKYKDLDEETRGAFADQFTLLKDSVEQMGEGLGLGADLLADFTYKIKVNLKGLSEEEAAAKLEAEFDKMAESMAGVVLTTDEYSRAEETKGQTLARLYGSLVGVNHVFDVLGATLLDASLASADWASDLVDAAGGMDKLAQSAQTFYDLYYSDGEKRKFTADKVNETMSGKDLDLRVSDADAKAKYRALVEQAIADKDEVLLAWLLDFADDFAAGVDAFTAGVDEAAAQLEEQFAEIARVREQTLSTLGLSMDSLVSGFIGEINAGRGSTAGAWLADEIAVGFEQAVYTQAVNTILASIIDGMITPMISAALTGSSIADAVSAAAIDNMIANANAALEALNVLLNSVEFIEGLEKIKVTVTSVGNSVGSSIRPMGSYSSSARETGNAATEAAQKMDAANDTAQRIAQERESLETRLLQLLGNTVELRRRELDKLDPSNHALQQHIWLLEDAQQAQSDYDAALKEVAAAQKAIDDIRATGTSKYLDAVAKYEEAQQRIVDITRRAAQEVRAAGESLLDWVTGTKNASGATAVQQATMSGREYERLLSLAAGGDKEALAKLSGAADSYLQAAEEINGSFDFAKIRGEVLREVAELGAKLAATVIPGGDEPSEMDAALQALKLAEDAMLAARDVALAIGAPLQEQTQSLVDEYDKAVKELAQANTVLEVQAALLASINAGVWAISGDGTGSGSGGGSGVTVVQGGNAKPAMSEADSAIIGQLTIVNARLDAALTELREIRRAGAGVWLQSQLIARDTLDMSRNGVLVYNHAHEPVYTKGV